MALRVGRDYRIIVMTQPDIQRLFYPTLIVKRLKVMRGGKTAYDQNFSKGVNAIVGENSSGKSTILNLIFYALGGDLRDWSPVALLCDEVWMEVSLNGKTATVLREIEQKSRTPMSIFGGSLSLAEKAPVSEWNKYPYSRSTTKESFSQRIFSLLGMPEAATDDSGSITLNQMLRLIYADQLSPVEELFKKEAFDNQDIRDAVGSLILGAYTNDVYALRQKLRSEEKLLSDAGRELTSLLALLQLTDSDVVGTEWAISAKAELEAKRTRIFEEIESLESTKNDGQAKDKLTLEAQESAFKRLREAQQNVGSNVQAATGLEFNISDSALFIESLKRHISELHDARDTAEFIDSIVFSSCPACFAPVVSRQGIIDLPDSTKNVCKLCKEPDDERAEARLVSLLNDANIQLGQSETLQQRRLDRLSDLRIKIKQDRDEWDRAAAEYNSLKSIPTTKKQQDIRQLYRNLGYAESQLKDLERQVRLAERIDELRKSKENINSEVLRLQDEIDIRLSQQVERRAVAMRKIEVAIISLLKGDLQRQDTFKDPKSIDFSFKENRITVDDATYFSASSRAILRSSFFIGLFSAALKDPEFRHPRILILDTTEDKGMEPERSKNLQEQIINISLSTNVAHQIIFATAMPSDQITEEMRIGHFSTIDDGTLLIG